MKKFKLSAPTKDELLKLIEEKFAQYHPAGYGTMIDDPAYDDSSDEWFAWGSRFASCD